MRSGKTAALAVGSVGIVLWATSIALAHDTGIPHAHPHGEGMGNILEMAAVIAGLIAVLAVGSRYLRR